MSNMTSQSPAGKRIESLLDGNSFVEIGGNITARSTDFNLQQEDTPADGVITGYGVIDGNLVYVYSQDASVLNGTIGEMHAKKITNLYDLAMKTGAPIIGLTDCAGLRLQEATDALHGFGTIYQKQVMASGVIPQITAVLGTCGGGMAVMPGLTDFTFMESEKGKLFVNAPDTLDGNEVSRLDTAAADYQSENTGLVDFVGSEDEILAGIRQLISILPANNEEDPSDDSCNDDLNRACPELETAAGDPAVALNLISDDHLFVEVKKAYGRDMVTGFIRLNGTTVGAVANRTVLYNEEGEAECEYEGVLTPRGCRKAASFVNFCDAFNIPVLTLTNVKGFMATKCAEHSMAKATAELTYAFANASVPKINVITDYAFGSAYLAMNSKSIGADLVFAWPEAKIGMMDPQAAANIIYDGKDAAVISEGAREYAQLQASALSAAKRGYVDDIIDAQDTRKYVIGAIEMLFTKREDRPLKKHGSV